MIDIENIKDDNLYTLKEGADLLDMYYKTFAYKIYQHKDIKRKLIHNRNYIEGRELKRIIREGLFYETNENN